MQGKEYRSVYVLSYNLTNLYLHYYQRFRKTNTPIKSENIPQSFLFEQKVLRHKKYELGFEIEVEKAQFKSLSVANEFVVLKPIWQKSYIFAFNVFAGQNKAKIYKRI